MSRATQLKVRYLASTGTRLSWLDGRWKGTAIFEQQATLKHLRPIYEEARRRFSVCEA